MERQFVVRALGWAVVSGATEKNQTGGTHLIRHRMGAFFAASLVAVLSSSARASFTFSDSFSPSADPQWSNSTGNWTTSGGAYYAQSPNNNPTAATFLPFDLTDATVDVTVNQVGDGGLFLRSDGTANNAILLVDGGNGYGQGTRGGNAGTSLYFHIIQNGVGSGPVNEVNGVFIPGQTYDLHITLIGDTCSVYVNGASTPADTLTNGLFSHGQIGLYDDQPNTTTGGGFGPAQSFSNFSVSGNLVPEPASLMLLALGGTALLIRRRRAA